MINDRIRDEVSEIHLVPEQERLCGPGSAPIMAAFTHLNPLGSRFSDGSYGVFYAAREKETAIAETRYHHELFLQATKDEPIQSQMWVYHVKVSGRYDDLRSVPVEDAIYDRDSFQAA